jgi:hypothetical protein
MLQKSSGGEIILIYISERSEGDVRGITRWKRIIRGENEHQRGIDEDSWGN